MRIERIDEPAGFFAVAAPFLERREAQHNLQLGFRQRLEANPHAYGDEDPRLYVVRDASDEIVAVATQTPPFGLVLSEVEADGVVEALVERLAADGLDLPALQGPVDAARRFAELWSAATGAEPRVGFEERIYEATRVEPPAGVPGSMRAFGGSDRDLAVAWMAAFYAEALPDAPGDNAERFVAERGSALWFWDDGDETVSVAGHSGDTPNGARVGPVYTPPELRGRGYASALTAALTARLLETRRFCFLFTNLANATSNSIYQRIGYRPVSDVTLWTFDRA